MEAGKAIYKLLKDSSTVGAICADRIYPEIADQTADLPLVVYTVQSANPSGTKAGTSTVDQVQFEVMTFSTNYAEAMSLANACRGALDRVGGSINGVQVQSIDFRTSGVDFDYTTDAHICVQTYDMRVLFTGTAAAYKPIHVQQTYDAIQVTLSEQQKTGGSGEFEFQGTTAVRIPFTVEDVKTSSDFSLSSSGTGIITITGAGIYRFSACVTFNSEGTNVEPTIYFQVESRIQEARGNTYIKGGSNNDHGTATAVQLVEVGNMERCSLRVYDDSNSTAGGTITHAIFLIERVST